jgi:hypothetical protein
MIGRAFAYKGSEADARRLDRHLWKDDNQQPDLCEMRNLFVHDSAEGMSVMTALRAASNAKINFWHIIVSPRKTLDAEERATVVDLLIAELKAGSHPLMVFCHNEKPRARRGGGGNHLHLVLGHVSPLTFHALDMRHHAPRLHKVMTVAAYQLEGVATASPWHKTILRSLRAEGNVAVADWLVDSLGEAPVLKPSRMTDSMRRSADAAGFALASFQAGLDRLWTTGAAQPELETFLSENGVAIRLGRSPNRIAFYHGELFVGTLDRILRLDASTVYNQATRRFSGLLDTHVVEGFPDSVRNSRKHQPPVAKALDDAMSSRRLSLQRQRRIDKLEAKLVSLRLERLHLMYDRAHLNRGAEVPTASAGLLPEPALLLGHDWQSEPVRERLYTAKTPAVERHGSEDKVAARIKRLLGAEAILETAVSAVWQDDRWISASPVELLRWAKKSVTYRKLDTGGDVGSAIEDENSGVAKPKQGMIG